MSASIRRGFADIAEGQMHYRTARPAAPTGKRPLVMFPGAAESSRSLIRLVARIGESRTVVAFDGLGQGDSSPPASPDVDMTYFADAAGRAIESLGPEFARVDAFGTHAGARVAAELAIARPERVGKVILDAMRRGPSPFWREYAETLDLSQYIDQEGTQFIKTWNKRRDLYLFFPPYKRDREALRGNGLPSADEMHDSALEMFKGIRSAHIAYRQAILYPTEERLPLLSVPTLAISARKDDKFGDLAFVTGLIPGGESAYHPHDGVMESTSDSEIGDLAAMLTDWLDR